MCVSIHFTFVRSSTGKRIDPRAAHPYTYSDCLLIWRTRKYENKATSIPTLVSTRVATHKRWGSCPRKVLLPQPRGFNLKVQLVEESKKDTVLCRQFFKCCQETMPTGVSGNVAQTSVVAWSSSSSSFLIATCFDILGPVLNPNTFRSVCVYTVITNGFSSFHCSCTILKSRGQRYPCHFLCQRSWVTCGKDIDQGRLIYVPAIVSTVDFLFLFMSCALFLRSGTCVRWNSTARQLRKSGEDYDILHTFDWPLPHSVSWVFDLNWSHRRLVSTNQKVMSGHFPVFRVEYESPKPYALRVHFKRHMTESRFYTVKSNRSSHKAK